MVIDDYPACPMDALVQPNVALVTLVVGTVIPLLVAAVAKLKASSRLKAGLNLALSVVGGAGAYALAHQGGFLVKELITALVETYVVSGVFYNNLWKPTGAAAAVASTIPGGIGTEQAVVDEAPPLVPLAGPWSQQNLHVDADGVVRVAQPNSN